MRIAAIGVCPPTEGNRILERGSMTDLVLHHIRREVDQALAWRPDLLLLPESCDRQLGTSAAAPEVRDLLSTVARESSAVVVYGVGREEVVVLERDGKAAGTHRPSGPGGAELITCSAGKLACVLSDELQDPGVMERYRDLHPDLLLLASRFPGGMLEQYWAFECRAHLASAVLFRSDLRMPCRILSPVGAVLAESTTSQTHARAVVNLDSAVIHLDETRGKLLRLQAEMGDGISIMDPGLLGGACVSNETSTGTVRDILRSAGIATIDEYFQRYLSERDRHLRARQLHGNTVEELHGNTVEGEGRR